MLIGTCAELGQFLRVDGVLADTVVFVQKHRLGIDF